MSIPVVLYSDYVCPFCYIAERVVLARLQAGFHVAIEWRGFELHPNTPPGGVSLHEFASMREIDSAREYTRVFAAEFGVRDIIVPWRIPNTRHALVLTEFARDEGRLDEFRAAVMDARWRRGANIEDESELMAMAARAGLDTRAAERAMSDCALDARVSAAHDEGVCRGVTRVPTFFIGDQRIVGCRSDEILAQAAEFARDTVPRTRVAV